MADGWLDGFEHKDLGPDGLTFVAGMTAWKLICHTTEGYGLGGAEATYRNYPPHFGVDVKARKKVQYVSIFKASYALKNLPGGIETNKGACIQIEFIGQAAKMGEYWTDDDLKWVAEEVFLPICRARGIPLVAVDDFHTYPPENGIRLNGREPWRLSFDAWYNFAGIMGHQHVPENHHGDPGKINIRRILSYCGAASTPPDTKDWFDMATPEELRAELKNSLKPIVLGILADESTDKKEAKRVSDQVGKQFAYVMAAYEAQTGKNWRELAKRAGEIDKEDTTFEVK